MRPPGRPPEPDRRGDPFAEACRYLTARERCAEEVRGHLRRRGYAREEIDEAIARLLERRLLDDRRFARLYVESRSRSSPRSGAFLVRELRRRGVDAETARAAVRDFLREVPEETLARLLLEKLKPRGPDGRERAARRLRARGFRAALALRDALGGPGGFDRDDEQR